MKALGVLGVLSYFLLVPFAIAQNNNPVPFPADPSPATPSGFRGDTLLRSSDMVKITVYGEDDLTTEARIEKDGTIRFPLLGPLTLAGETVDEATEKIRRLLGEKYIKNPQVTLMIISHAKQRLTIMGEVKKPGEVEIPDEGNLDFLAAIALAGGFSDLADLAHITVRRVVNGKDQIIDVDARKLAHDSTVKPFYIRPGDTITVRQRMF